MKYRDGLLALALAATACTPAPSAQTLPPQPPPALHEEVVAIDRTGEAVLFGGVYVDSTGDYDLSAATYVFGANGWRQLTASPAPPRRGGAAATYDPDRGRVVMFGGYASGPDSTAAGAVKPCPSCTHWVWQLDDVWAYDDAGWSRIADGPQVSEPALVFDTQRNRLLLLGHTGNWAGHDGPKRVSVWASSDGRAWEEVDTAGPTIESPVRAVFDAGRGVVVSPVLHGPDAGVWEWNGSWQRIAAPNGPSERHGFVLAFDEARNATVLFGGQQWEPNAYFNDLWSWNGTAWSQLHADSATAPAPRADGTLLFDHPQQRLLLIGGIALNNTLFREEWAYGSDGWRRLGAP